MKNPFKALFSVTTPILTLIAGKGKGMVGKKHEDLITHIEIEFKNDANYSGDTYQYRTVFLKRVLVLME